MILFFHGADSFRSRQKLRDVLDKFKRDVDPQGYNLTRLDGKTAKVQEILSALSAAPFMARKRLVLVESLSAMDWSEAEEENIIAAIERALTDEVVFVVWEEGLDKTTLKSTVFSALKSSPYTVEFAALDQSQIGGWMRAKLDAAGVQLDSAAWAHVLLAVEDDLYRASSEAEKIIAFAQSQGKQKLAMSDIKQLVAGGLRDDVFGLVDAVSSGRAAPALSLLHDQLKGGSHALELIGLLIRQYRLLQQVIDGLAEGLSPDRIASVYKMHPFVAKKMASQARQVNADKIKRAYATLIKLDRDIKSTGLPADMLISAAVAQLASR